MIFHSRAVRTLFIAATVVAGTLAVSAQFRIPEQLPPDRRNDILVKTKSTEQPQLSQYAVELPAGNRLTMLPVAGSVYMIAGPGTGNVTVQVGDDGVVLVDAGSLEMSDMIMQAIRVVSRGEVNYIIMSGPQPDHFTGNGKLASPPFGRPPNQGQQNLGGFVRDTLQPPVPQQGRGGRGGINQVNIATIVAHENVLNRMSAPTGEQAAYPFEMWPTSTFFTPKKTLYWNGEAIEIYNEQNSVTDGDTITFFRRSDVIAAGDIIDTNGYPRIDVERGGTIQGVLEALNDIIDLAVPAFNQQGGTKIVPGHGRIYNEADVVEYRDMMTIIHDRVKQGLEKGMTVEQIKAMRPTLDYDGLYSRPDWTGDMLVDVIYRNLQQAAAR